MISQRTRNRIKEHKAHGLVIDWERRSTSINGFGNQTMVFANCPCGWFGWFPMDEVKEEA